MKKEILATECSYDNVVVDEYVLDKLNALNSAIYKTKDIWKTEDINVRVEHAKIGLRTEVGELFDAYKKHWFYHKPLDVDNVLEECGDIIWYCEILEDENLNISEVKMCVNKVAKLFDSSYQECSDRVVKKLRVRYPDGFTEFDAEVRDTSEEMKAFTS